MSEKQDRKEYMVEYDRDHYDRVLLRLPKGYRAKIKNHIGEESMNAYLKRLIDQDMTP